MCLVRLVGKRALSLVSMSGCAFSCLSLGAYTYVTTQHHWSSVPTIPLLLFCTLYFTINLGISPIPWMLISEVFPNRWHFFKKKFLFFQSDFRFFYNTSFKMCSFVMLLQRSRSGQRNMCGDLLRHRVSGIENVVESPKLGGTAWMLFPVRDPCRHRYCVRIQLFARDWRQDISRNRKQFREEKQKTRKISSNIKHNVFNVIIKCRIVVCWRIVCTH